MPFNHTQNINSEAGIRYGVINAKDVPHLFSEIISNGVSTTYQEYLEQVDRSIQTFFEEKEEHIENIQNYFDSFNLDKELCEQFVEAVEGIEGDISEADIESLRGILLENTQLEFEEESYRYEKEGEVYELSYLGGGPIIWVIKSPVTTLTSLCSPCVPNAGNLNEPSQGGYLCYAVPVEWFDKDHPSPYTTQPVEEKQLTL